jgi:hypothetical protein
MILGKFLLVTANLRQKKSWQNQSGYAAEKSRQQNRPHASKIYQQLVIAVYFCIEYYYFVMV